MVIVLWLPIAAVLALLFRPTFDIARWRSSVFAVAIWGAYLIRSLMLWVLGLVTFWTTRVGAIFELVFTAELLLSGRLVPLSLMPDWVQPLAASCRSSGRSGSRSRRWSADLPKAELLGGLAMQALWTSSDRRSALLVWRFARPALLRGGQLT